MPRFVVREHYATSHHSDLGLERDGVLVSWAVPKGMPTDPKKNRPGIKVEDHALSHLGFEDDTPVPDGPDGAVRVSIRDGGIYEPEVFEEGMVIVALHGRRLEGRHSIFRTGGKNWLVHRVDPTNEGEAG